LITYFKKSTTDGDFEVLDQPVDGCWIHVDEATTNDVNQISHLTGIDYSDIYDCLDKYEVPRIEKSNEDVLIFTRHPHMTETGLYTTTLTIILNQKYFITICPHKSTIIESFVMQKPKLLTTQQSQFLIFILLKITQEFTIQIRKIRTRVLKREKDVTKVDSDDITALTLSEENLNQYLSTLAPLRAVLEAITSGKYTSLDEKDQDLLEDLLNASIQSEDLCSVVMRSIRSLRDSYQIIFTNQLNKTIKLLTALTIILSLPTMVASLYGMNVKLPVANSGLAFIYILIFIVAISYGCLMIFKKKKWL
jgi:magnesium transporter